jgi:hypothetical protein
MNCANHPEVAAAAYCQSCGKPLCTGCMRSVGGVIYCEPCLAARLSPPSIGGAVPATGLHAHPVLAGLLGFIPGVGAMYNGQFVKALAHVLIFAVFVSLSDRNSFFGLLAVAWTFYQVFDAAQTAKARRDGLPLPNPFGLNDLGVRLGMTPPAPHYASGFSPTAAPGGPTAAVDPSTGQSPGQDPAAGGPFQAPPASYATPQPPAGTPGPGSSTYGSPAYPSSSYQGAYQGSAYQGSAYQGSINPGSINQGPVLTETQGHRHPVGAIVLIVIGLLLLLHTLGIFEDEWIRRAWPLIIIGVGAWLLYRRTNDLPRGGA